MKSPTKGSDRQEGSVASLRQKRPGVKNTSSTKKKKQRLIDDNSTNDWSTGWLGGSSLDSDSDDDNNISQKGLITTYLTEKSMTELVRLKRNRGNRLSIYRIS